MRPSTCNGNNYSAARFTWLLAATFVAFQFTQGAMPIRAQDKADASRSRSEGLGSELLPLRFDEKELYGRYYFGDGFGLNCTLELDAQHHFSYQRAGCLGVDDENKGTWLVQGDVVECNREKPNKRGSFLGMGTRFIPVHWGERYYLVDENEMPGFCAGAINKDKLTKEMLRGVNGSDYVKWNGKDAPPVYGEPVLPERFQTFYENGPIETSVVRTMPNGNVVLDKGDADRLRAGLHLTINALGYVDVTVLSTTAHESIVQPLYLLNGARSIKVGDTFTTGGYWHRPRGTGIETFAKPPAVPTFGKQPGSRKT